MQPTIQSHILVWYDERGYKHRCATFKRKVARHWRKLLRRRGYRCYLKRADA